jgi:chromosome partitioning protein
VHRTIAITNQKGGVGKTTTAINLGASLALAEKKTLIVDLDPQGNATTGLGFDRTNLKHSIYEILTEDGSVTDVICNTELTHLFLVPATRDLVGVEIELVAAQRRESRLKDALQGVRADYDYVLIDCPPSLGLLTLNALVAADYLVVPIQCEYYALEGLSSIVETIKLVQRSLNPELALAGILLTMFDSRNRLAHQVADEVRRHFPGQVFDSIIYRNVRLSESPSHGKPVLLYDPQSMGAQNYLALARELMTTEEVFNRAEKGSGERA